MPAFETLQAWRIVADAAAVDVVVASTSTTLRFSADDALVLSADRPAVNDEHAIIELDAGWSGTWYTTEAFERTVRHFIEWDVPANGLGQGLVAGVPSKVWTGDSGLVLIACPTAYAHELADRLPA